MMAATLAFTLQATFITPSTSRIGEAGYFHHNYERNILLADFGTHRHAVVHVHTDGTAHQHVVADDDDDDALNEHIQKPGCPCCWNMASVVGALPSLDIGGGVVEV